jgi:hypothetical protein
MNQETINASNRQELQKQILKFQRACVHMGTPVFFPTGETTSGLKKYLLNKVAYFRITFVKYSERPKLGMLYLCFELSVCSS